MDAGKTYGIDIRFETLKLPLFHDAIVLAKPAAQGKHGLGKSLELLAPGVFKALDTDFDADHIEAVFVNQQLLTKITTKHLIQILRAHVFEHIGEGELIQVDMNVRISIHNIRA